MRSFRYFPHLAIFLSLICPIFSNRPLWREIKKGNFRSVCRLINFQEATVKEVDGYGDTALHIAACYGNVHILYYILSLNPDLEAVNVWKQTPLLKGLRSTNVANGKVIKVLVNAGARTDVVDDARETPLHLAARNFKHEDVGVVDLLIKKGVRLNARNMYGNTALFLAAECGLVNTIHALVNEGAEADSELLHVAVSRGFPRAVEMLKLFLTLETNLDVRDYYGQTPVHAAVNLGSLKKVRILLEGGSEVNTVNRHKDSLLHTSLTLPHGGAITDLLLLKGARLDVKNEANLTPFEWAVARKWNMPIYMMNYGVEIDTLMATELLKKQIPSCYKLLRENFHNFDDFIVKMTKARVHDEITTDLKQLTQIYEKNDISALCHILTLLYQSKNNGGSVGSGILYRKLDISDALVWEIGNKTFLRILPVEIIADILYQSKYYGWKVESLAWNVAVASHTLKIDLGPAITVAVEMFMMDWAVENIKIFKSFYESL